MKDDLAIALYGEISADDEPREFEHWHYSSLAECPRAQYFKRLKVPTKQKAGAGKMLRWKAGHILEEVVRPYLTNIYPDLISNKRMTDEDDDTTGEFDNYSQKEKTLIEIKSVNGRAFKYRKVNDGRTHLRDEKPYDHHLLQNHGYARMLTKRDLPVTHIHFVYISLDGLICTYKVPVSSDTFREIGMRLDVLNRAWMTQIPPECICDDKSHKYYYSTMQYCDYKNGDECCALSLMNNNESEDSEWREV